MKDSQIQISHQQKVSCHKSADLLIHFKISANEFLLKPQIDLAKEIIISVRGYLGFPKLSNDQCNLRHDRIKVDRTI